MFTKSSSFVRAYKSRFETYLGKSFEDSSNFERYTVLSRLMFGRIARQKLDTNEEYRKNKEKTVYYFSMEFLIGSLLENYLINLGIRDVVEEGLSSLGVDLDEILECEKDAGLGNGGLGRLAACFLDSMAFLGIEGHGTGLRYRFGLFKQQIENGMQIEVPDNWASEGYPWEQRKPESAVIVKFGGTVQGTYVNGHWKYRHETEDLVRAVPYDVPIVGYGGETVNNLRLWSAETVEDKFDLEAFNRGEYSNAMRHMNNCKALTYILYPNDSTEAGKALRLKQEYLLVSAGVTSIVKDYIRKYGKENLNKFYEKISIHTNDTHPAMCVPELMRILIDDYEIRWDEAWKITQKTVSYTNHTVLPEAMETWNIGLFRSILPRIYMIIEEIDRRYKSDFERDDEKWVEQLKATSILWDGQVKMANLSIIGSHSVNGVAALHTEILKEHTLKDFYALSPEKFNNKTNGVSHRRFLLQANPKLSMLISDTIGEEWINDPMKLEKLLESCDDEVLLDRLTEVKYQNKVRLAKYIKKHMDIDVNPNSVFDVHIKRIHAYKRQLLSIFKVMAIYNDLKLNPEKEKDIVPHTFIFAGKAAQSYTFAKDIIRLINAVAKVVNNDPDLNDSLKVVFLENFNVTLAQKLYPATDISEQISTAGFEASGTGNMKFMFNGAITLGTLDGANVEIKDMAGEENAYIFGLKDDEVLKLKQSGTYNAYSECQASTVLRQITHQLVDGFLEYPNSFRGIYDTLFHSNDEYLVLKDFDSYMKAWYEMGELYKTPREWAKKSLANIANAGYFTSDRTIAQYAREVWDLECDAHIDV